jgi:D-alanyl-D-alanine carboxypeptidase
MNHRWTFCLLVFLMLSVPTVRATNAENALRTQLAAGLARGMPSISIAIATPQGVIWSDAVGYADLPSHSLAHTGYMYGIGSITKMFVACVIEQLVDEGRLSLDSTGAELLGKEVLAGIPNAARATVRQLLDHTSGVPSWELDPEWIRHGRGSAMDVSHIWGKTEALYYLKSGRDQATNEPGLGYRYSNSNYTLLGLIIEKVTGHDAVLEIHERLLKPRGLTDIVFEGFEPVDSARVPSRYHFGTADFVRDAGMQSSFRRIGGPLIDVSRSNLSTEWTAGAILATARDLALFVRDLRDGRVVSAAALRRMAAFKATDDPDEDMGQGLALDRYGSEQLIGYTGNVLGFGAAVGWIPGEDVVIALLTNVGAMHAGDTAYYPEKLLRNSRVISAARAVARERTPKTSDSLP